MSFELWPAVGAGAIGGAAMMVARLLLRAGGMSLRMDVTRIWGMLVGVRGDAERPVGILIHLLVSVAVGIVYAIAFDLTGAATTLGLWGLAAGFVHWIIAGFMMAVLPVVHPEIPGERFAPGAFVKNFSGPDVIGFLVGHLVYGTTVGIAYAWFAGGLEAAF